MFFRAGSLGSQCGVWYLDAELRDFFWKIKFRFLTFRKKERSAAGYDPDLDMNMFIYTIEGFARITIYQDEVNEDYYQKAINKIIELYK